MTIWRMTTQTQQIKDNREQQNNKIREQNWFQNQIGKRKLIKYGDKMKQIFYRKTIKYESQMSIRKWSEKLIKDDGKRFFIRNTNKKLWKNYFLSETQIKDDGKTSFYQKHQKE